MIRLFVRLALLLVVRRCQVWRLRRTVHRLHTRDALRRLELADTDATLTESERRECDQRAMTLRVAERLYLAHEVLAHLAEKRVGKAGAVGQAGAVVLTETDYCPL